jgi:hypothetical protein
LGTFIKRKEEEAASEASRKISDLLLFLYHVVFIFCCFSLIKNRQLRILNAGIPVSAKLWCESCKLKGRSYKKKATASEASRQFLV